MQNLKIFSFLLIATMALVTTPFIKDAFANTDWKLYVSDTDLFTVMFPGNPDEKVSSFRVGNGLIVQNAEALAFIDQRPYKDIVKKYIVKFDQTIGPKITAKSRLELVEHELKLYENIYSEHKAKTIQRRIKEDTDRTIGHLTMVYENIDNGIQAVQVKIHLTETSKFHQIFSGPEKDLISETTADYFKSFNPKSGFIPNEGTMNEDWRRIESPFSLFAVKIPPVTVPYFPKEPTITKEGNTERIGMVFTDPIWTQSIFYNITGYQLDSEMSFDLAEKALLEKHLKRHGRSMVGIRLKKDFIGETPYIETSYAIKPPEGYSYLTHARVRALFLGNYLMVQEVVGPKHLVEAPFTSSFFDLIEFTPKKAFQKEIQRHMDLGNR